jgi:FkbM family methyltransferase
MDTNKFIWEPECHVGFKEIVEQEIFVDRVYEKFFEVEEGDVVFDIGASLGPFTYSILEKNPSHVFTFEPSFEEFKTLVLNTRQGPVTHINKGISNYIGEFQFEHVFDVGDSGRYYSTTFKKVIEDYNIQKIDFLKSDCEGGEYDIFTSENLLWIKQNVKKIAGEWHLGNPVFKEKFRIFRDTYLRIFPNFKVRSYKGHNIEERLWTDEFIESFSEIMIYIDNRD